MQIKTPISLASRKLRHFAITKTLSSNDFLSVFQKSQQDDEYMDQDVASKLQVELTTPGDMSGGGQNIVYETSTVKEEPISDADDDGLLSQVSTPSTSGVTFSVANLNQPGSDASDKPSTSQALDFWKPSTVSSAAAGEILGLPTSGDGPEAATASGTSPLRNGRMDVTTPSDETLSLKSMSIVSTSDSVPESKSTTDRARDQYDAYGEYIASKLRKLDWKSCAYVQKAFSDIIFEAEMGKYKDAS